MVQKRAPVPALEQELEQEQELELGMWPGLGCRA
jgi:hypothetical protein